MEGNLRIKCPTKLAFNRLPVASRKRHDHSIINPKIEVRSQAAIGSAMSLAIMKFVYAIVFFLASTIISHALSPMAPPEEERLKSYLEETRISSYAVDNWHLSRVLDNLEVLLYQCGFRASIEKWEVDAKMYEVSGKPVVFVFYKTLKDERISLNLEDVSFYELLEKIASKTGTALSIEADEIKFVRPEDMLTSRDS